jgi:hypothetical protein
MDVQTYRHPQGLNVDQNHDTVLSAAGVKVNFGQPKITNSPEGAYLYLSSATCVH